MFPTLSAPKQAHRAGIICDDLVRLLVLALVGMKTIKGNQTGVMYATLQSYVCHLTYANQQMGAALVDGGQLISAVR